MSRVWSAVSVWPTGARWRVYSGVHLNLFIEAHRRDYAVGIVAFADHAQTIRRVTCDRTRFRSRLSPLEPHGYTVMHRGILLATRLLRHQVGEKTIVLVTDGMTDDREPRLEAARLVRAEGITPIVIGIRQADEAFLTTLRLIPRIAGKVTTTRLAKAWGSVLKKLLKS